MTDTDKAQIDSLHSDGIQTCHIMGHMVANKGGYDVVGFIIKDLYNYFGKKTIVDIKYGGVVASLSYLRGKVGLDPMLYAQYKWVLSLFLEAMGNWQPKAVMTDGDLAMREAVRVVFLEACHKQCAWHLNKNAQENIKTKGFWTDFNKAMYSNFTVDEFEEFWANLVETNGLQGNNWVSKTYENMKLWATAYFQNKFFGRIRTTPQCEAINSMMKRYVKKKCSIYEFMHKFDQILREYKNNKHVADFKSYSYDPTLTTGLDSIEKDAQNFTH